MNVMYTLGDNPNHYRVGDIVRLATWGQLLEKWSDFIEYRNGEQIISDRLYTLAEWQDDVKKVRGRLVKITELVYGSDGFIGYVLDENFNETGIETNNMCWGEVASDTNLEKDYDEEILRTFGSLFD